jgi:ABC-type multidrug transport system fused ATPase/permease subunit
MSNLTELLFGFYKENTNMVLLSIISQIIYSVLQVVIIPVILSKAFHSSLDINKLKSQLYKLVLIWVLLNIISSIALYLHNKIEPALSKYIVEEIINKIFKKYENENINIEVSVLIDRLHLIRTNLHDLYYISTAILIPKILVIFIVLVSLSIINIKLGILVFLCLILQYSVIFAEFNKCVELNLNESKIKTSFYKYLENIFSNINSIQSCPNSYEYEYNILKKHTDHIHNTECKSNKCVNTKEYMGYTSNVLIFMYIIYYIYQLYKNNKIDNKQVTTVILIIIGLFDLMSDMSYYLPEFTRKIGIFKSNEEFLKNIKTIILNTQLKNIDLTNFDIKFDNVSFKYKKTDKYIFNNFNILIPEKSFTTIYGPSGSGKSTFVKLLFGILKPESGGIYIGNENIKDIELKKLRTYISYVEQNTFNLFNRSIFENIIYGNEFSQQEKENIKLKIKEILLKYNFYKVFEKLDKNKEKFSFLDSNITDTLSGGQKKLIHLLRIEFNSNSKICILDEPTNGLDSISRNNVIEFIKQLNKNKTIIIITHDSYFKEFSSQIINL